MPLMTIGQVLASNPMGYEKELVDRYLENVQYEEEPDKQLANEMFRTFGSLICVRFGDVVFTREEI